MTDITTVLQPAPVIDTVLQPAPVINTNIGVGQGPAGVGLSPAVLTAAENLTAGMFVNIYSGGVRKASNDSIARGEASGFILNTVTAGVQVTVNLAGVNTMVSGLTVGPVYLGLNGLCTNAPPTVGPGVVQQVGWATAADKVNFMPSLPVVLAGTAP